MKKSEINQLVGVFMLVYDICSCVVSQWFSTFFKSRTPKLSYWLSRTPYKLTQIDTILELLLKVM